MSNYITPIYVDYAGKMRKSRTTGEVYSESNKVILKRGDTATLAIYFLSQATNLPFALASGATITCAIKEKNKFDATTYICYGSTNNPPSETDTSYELTIPLYSTELNELLGVNGDTDIDPAYIDLGIEISWSENNGDTWRSTTDPVTVRIYNDIIREETDLPILEVIPAGGDMPSKVGENESIGVSTYAARADHRHALETLGEAKIVGSSTIVPTVEVDEFGRVVGLTTNAIQTLTTLGESKTVGSSLVVPSVTIDEYGRVTALTSNAIQTLTTIGESKVVGSPILIPRVSIDEYGRVTSLQSQAIGALTTNQIAGLSTSAPANVATAPVSGLSTFAARADHAHALTTVGTHKIVGGSSSVPKVEVDEFGRVIGLTSEAINPASGNAPVWRGPFLYIVEYVNNDIVFYNGSSYLCVVSSSIFHYPDDSSNNFVLLVQKGADGADGQDGADGIFLNSWKGDWANVVYLPGDIVRYGGNIFLLDEFPSNLSPFTYRPDESQYWKLLLSGMKNMGEWAQQATYHAGCIVTYLGSTYLAITTTLGNVPSTNPYNWQLLASKGDTGEDGPPGSDASVTYANYSPVASNDVYGTEGTAIDVARGDHKHPLPSYTGDVAFNVLATTVEKIRGVNVTASEPSSGQTLQFDGTNIVWADAPAGGSGGGGLTFYFNYNTTPDLPTTGLPTLDNSVAYKELGRSADSTATSLTSATLPSDGTYVAVCGFVSDLQDPNSLVIPVGLWDFNVWCSAVSNDTHTSIRAKVYSFDGTASTLIATSAASVISSTLDMVTLTVTVPQTTLTTSDRIVVVIEAATSGNNHTVTLNFGNSMPSHTHTTLPSVGGSGLVRVINGVIQSQGSKIQNTDFDDNTLESAKLHSLSPSPAGTFGTGTKSPRITVNEKGQITEVTLEDILYSSVGSQQITSVGWSLVDSGIPYSYIVSDVGYTTEIRSLAYGNSTYVLLASVLVISPVKSLISTSTNGSSWTRSGSDLNQSSNDLIFGLSKFFAVGNKVSSSTDGLTWTEKVAESGSLIWYGAALGTISSTPTIMVVGALPAGGSQAIVKITTDGETWTDKTSSYGNTLSGLRSVCYGNGKFVVVGEDGAIRYTTDATNWSTATSGVTTLLQKVAFGNNLFVAVGVGGVLLTSEDAITWTSRTSGFGSVNDIFSVTYGNGLWVVCGENSNISYSTDGINWRVDAIPFSQSYMDAFSILYANSKFVCAGGFGQLVQGTAATSISGGGVVLKNTKVVGPSGDSTTIQGCIDLINDATINNSYTIIVPPGKYIENLTLRPHISITGLGGNKVSPNVVIEGCHTYVSTSNQVSSNRIYFSNVFFNSTGTTTPTFSLSGNYSGQAHFTNCGFGNTCDSGSFISTNGVIDVFSYGCRFANSISAATSFDCIKTQGADVYLYDDTVADTAGRFLNCGYVVGKMLITSASSGSSTFVVADATGLANGMTVYSALISGGKGYITNISGTTLTLSAVSLAATTAEGTFNTLACTTTLSNDLVTVNDYSHAGVSIGMLVTGTNIASGTTVIAKPSSTTIQLSRNVTGAGSTTLTFGKPSYVQIFGGSIISYGNGTGTEAIKMGSGLLVGKATSINTGSLLMNGVNLASYGTTFGLIASNFGVKDTTASYYCVTGAYGSLLALSDVSFSNITGIAPYNTTVNSNVTVSVYSSYATPIANGGTGATTAQAALNALAGAVTNNRVLRGNGTNIVLAQVVLTSDVTGVLPIANGGTGANSAQAALNALAGAVTANRVLRGNGTNIVLAQVVLTTDVTGTLPVANGGTGSTTSTGTAGTAVVLATSPTITTPTFSGYTETVGALGTVGASATISLASSNYITATLTSATACTFTMPTATTGKTFTLLIKQPATGTATTATFTGVKWAGGSAPTITATLGRLDILQFRADGTNWYGNVIGQNYTY